MSPESSTRPLQSGVIALQCMWCGTPVVVVL